MIFNVPLAIFLAVTWVGLWSMHRSFNYTGHHGRYVVGQGMYAYFDFRNTQLFRYFGEDQKDK